ncbi:eEF1A lysine and N-terminal methyltransferase homolog isoform X2 [Aethina tumida]|nr:eEF1A lysine and N-terminal methyltransferase homolog isoform X2 [Aethina tumida]
MLSQNEKDRPDLKYLQMDALNTTFDNEQFNVVLDKGTLDALMPNDNPDTVTTITKYFEEIRRVLKIGGRYICVTLLQEHILNILLSYFPSNNWMFRAVRCFDAEKKAIENGENAFPVFITICTKFKDLPRKILELNLGSFDKMQRLESVEDVKTHISGAQRASFVCSGLKRSLLNEDDEVSFDLMVPGSDKARFTVYVVDVSPAAKNSQYAAFIVPQGREAEWMFSTKAGRKCLVKTTKHNRLAIITMHRGQVYNSFEAVQDELSDIVCNLAPANMTTKKIPFLSLGSDVGKRTVRHEGKSELSGGYIIEDVETDTKEKFRRLFFSSTQMVIQSEAKLKTILKKGQPKEIVDLNFLSCQHHIYMSVGAHLAANGLTNAVIAVIGLGGGNLCSFLHKFLPNAKITGVDIDKDMLKIATDWFGFQQNDKLSVVIEDGLEFIRNAVRSEKKINALLFDVDSKDTSIGMSCPPKQFLDDSVLDDIVTILDYRGLFVLNIVLRDTSLRPEILLKLKKKFKTIVAYKFEADVNEIMICSKDEIEEEKLKQSLMESCKVVNKFFKNKNLKCDICVSDYISSLKINS